jgi:hypothetical protein
MDLMTTPWATLLQTPGACPSECRARRPDLTEREWCQAHAELAASCAWCGHSYDDHYACEDFEDCASLGISCGGECSILECHCEHEPYAQLARSGVE